MNDLAWDAVNRLIYITTTDESPLLPGSVIAFDPRAGSIRTAVRVTPQPTKLAVSGDGQFVYVGLDAGGGIRRLRAPSLVSDLSIAVALPGNTNPPRILALHPAPNNPRTLAVIADAAGLNGGALIYDDAALRPRTGFQGVLLDNESAGGGDGLDLAWSDDGTRIYLLNGLGPRGLHTFTVDPQGMTLTRWERNFLQGRFRKHGTLLYLDEGQKFDIATGRQIGKWADYATPYETRAELLANGKTFSIRDYLNPAISFPVLGGFTISALSDRTFEELDSLTIVDVLADAGRLITWGSNGLAFANPEWLLVFEGTFAESGGGPTPVGTLPTVSSGTLTTNVGTLAYRLLGRGVTDVLRNPCTGGLYVAFSGASNHYPNSIIELDPDTRVVRRSVFVGSEPSRITLSADCRYLYSALYFSNSVSRVRLSDFTLDATIPVRVTSAPESGYGQLAFAADVAVDPVQSTTIAVAKQTLDDNTFCRSIYMGVDVIDNTTPRQRFFGEPIVAPSALTWASNSNVLYGIGGNEGLAAYSVDATGITGFTDLGATGGFGGSLLHYDTVNGRLYDQIRNVFDLRANRELGPVAADWNITNFTNTSICGSFSAAVATDPVTGKIFYAYLDDENSVGIDSYDSSSFARIARATMPISIVGFPAIPTRAARWGANGLAVVTFTGYLILLQGALATG